MNKLINFVKIFTKKNIPELDDAEKIGTKYFCLSKELKAVLSQIDASPYSVGIYLGEIKKNKFLPSIALIDMVAKHTDKKVIINNLGETMFLYKKSVFEENFKKRFVESGSCIVFNKEDEVLGYGEINTGKKKILKPILDRGDFLRRDF